jgi:hypothetical protein
MAYSYARLPNAGLGNRLFSWARSVVYAHIHSLTVIEPTWSQIKIGPLLRREQDARLYFGLFQSAPHYLRGLRKYWLLATGSKITEPSDLQTSISTTSSNTIILFETWRDYFTPLVGWNTYLLEELCTITRPEHLRAVEQLGSIPVALHIRRGDFTTPTNENDLHTKGAVRTPLEWYQQVLTLIRTHSGTSAPAYIFSDGREEELAPLLSMPDVRLARTGSAIGDLLALSKASVILGTGGSTFTAWAIYLGKMPSVVHPGQSLNWYGLRHNDDTYLDVFDPNSPDPRFLQQATERLKRVF